MPVKAAPEAFSKSSTNGCQIYENVKAPTAPLIQPPKPKVPGAPTAAPWIHPSEAEGAWRTESIATRIAAIAPERRRR